MMNFSISSGRMSAVAGCVAAVVMTVSAAAAFSAGPTEAEMIVDFKTPNGEWRTINDGVMGGVSSSTMSISDGVATFSGVVSLENNGGFASVRSLPADHDLGEFDGVALRLRGDGKRYAFRLRTTDRFDGPSYQAMIEPDAGEWSELVIPFGDFEPVYRGRPVPGSEPLDPSRVKTFGFLISGKQDGEFRLDIEWIRGWKASDDPQSVAKIPVDSTG